MRFAIPVSNDIGTQGDRWLGELSYPFYILHVFCLSPAAEATRHWLLAEGLTAWIGLSLAVILSAIALSLETQFIEPWRTRFAGASAAKHNSGP